MVTRKNKSLARSWAFGAFAVLGIACVMFALVEGFSSVVIFAFEVSPSGEFNKRYYVDSDERRHLQYDETLGWSNVPNVHLPNLYGPGKYMRTNMRGFRNDEEISDSMPAGRIRIVCSGDSFTFGQGVANDRAWCNLLVSKNARIQAVNMGQRGYGVDQAYLWYMRDGKQLEHSIHIFAFISDDFNRMRDSNRRGFGKPVLRLRDFELVTTNVPVSRFRTWRPWMTQIGRAASELRSVRLARGAIRRIANRTANLEDSSTWKVAEAVFNSLRRTNEMKNSKLVLLWLPTLKEIGRENRRWFPRVKAWAAANKSIFIDLGEDLRELPSPEACGFFIGKRDDKYIDATGHYNEAGNVWVAERLYSRLRQVPELGAILEDEAMSEILDKAD